MTLDEKIDCLATPRRGAAARRKGSPHIEGYHGVAQGGPSNWGRRNPTATTQFPQAYGLGATWDPELLRRRRGAQARRRATSTRAPEVRPRGGLVVRAPNVDLARDPRWGRTEEGYGEDPFHRHARQRLHRAACRATIRATGRRRRCSSTSSRTATRTAATRSSSNFDERLLREYYAKAVRAGRPPGRRARDDGRLQRRQRTSRRTCTRCCARSW